MKLNATVIVVVVVVIVVIVIAVVVVIVVAIVGVTIDVADIGVCPPDHRRAFSRGTKCCFYEDFGTKFVAAWTTEFCPSGDSVNCSHASGCEDNPPSCYRDFEIEGFSPV